MVQVGCPGDRGMVPDVGDETEGDGMKRRRMSKQTIRAKVKKLTIKRGKWISGKIMVTRNGVVKMKVSARSVKRRP